MFPRSCGRKFSGTRIAGDCNGARIGGRRGRLPGAISQRPTLSRLHPLLLGTEDRKGLLFPAHKGAPPALGSSRSLLPCRRNAGSYRAGQGSKVPSVPSLQAQVSTGKGPELQRGKVTGHWPQLETQLPCSSPEHTLHNVTLSRKCPCQWR